MAAIVSASFSSKSPQIDVPHRGDGDLVGLRIDPHGVHAGLAAEESDEFLDPAVGRVLGGCIGSMAPKGNGDRRAGQMD